MTVLSQGCWKDGSRQTAQTDSTAGSQVGGRSCVRARRRRGQAVRPPCEE